MADTYNEIDQAIDALHAIKLIRHTHASGPEGQRLVSEIIAALAASDRGMGPHGGIQRNVADAISRAYGGKPLSQK